MANRDVGQNLGYFRLKHQLHNLPGRVLRLIYSNEIFSIIIDNVSLFFGQSHDFISIELIWFLVEKIKLSGFHRPLLKPA